MKTANDVNTENNVNTEENVNYDVTTGEIMTGEIVVTETDTYKVIKLENGKFKKQMKYKAYVSRQPETQEEEDKFYTIFNDSDSDLVTQLKNMVKKEITVAHIFITPYEKFDENTGTVTDAVNTTIEDVDGSFYATSSKSVYHKLLNLMNSFGKPSDENYIPFKVLVTGTQRTNGVQIDLSYKGRIKQ